MATKIRIADDVMEVLKRSTITETSLQLPNEQLERSLYSRVNKIIEAAGGKWNKTAKAHVFPSDPREALGMAIETGTVANKQQIFQQFFTPSAVAEMMCRDVQEGDAVLEPSAGAGSIAMAAAAKGAAVVCFELQAELAEAALRRQDERRARIADIGNTEQVRDDGDRLMEPHGLHDVDLRDLIQHDDRQAEQSEQEIPERRAHWTASMQRSQRVG